MDDELREFLLNKDSRYPSLEDLPYRWEQIPADEPSRIAPQYPHRVMLLGWYSNWAYTKPWAWEGLRRLLDMLLERHAPIPGLLQRWANQAASRQRLPPNRSGAPEKDDRNDRIVHALRVLLERRLTVEKAISEIASVFPSSDPMSSDPMSSETMSSETIRSVIRKVRHDHHFGYKGPPRRRVQ